MERSITLGEIANQVGGEVEGDSGLKLQGVRTLQDAGPEHMAFVARADYSRRAGESRAGALLVSKRGSLSGRNLLRVEDPYLALSEVLEIFHPPERVAAGIDPQAKIGADCSVHPQATIQPGAVLGRECHVGARAQIQSGAVIGDGCRIGEDTIVCPNATLYRRTVLGNRVIVHAGAVLGSDGFGFARRGEEYRKIPQVGWVEVGDDVEIGANTTIDRGTLGPTRIARGTKIDNLVQVAHNVEIGEHCALAAQSGLAGSTRLGRDVAMAGQSGAAGHLNLGDGARVGAKSAVLRDLPPGAFVIGHPAIDHREWKRIVTALSRLPDLLRRLRGKLAPVKGKRRKG
ncbi:MAG: UDP-3-O-(3-hydroxymyristoyl)glucosamine N-acyltransferase [Acidobacteria bacterium]|nr:UDP-3-O-(3-hydroxymyristoyl)glucosamine N-acyltransferase [Acidobacteriota bacterium]